MTEKRLLFIHQFEQLYKENYQRLYHYAFTIVDDMDLAKDLVGEVFSTVWDNYDTLDPERIKGYLLVSVRNSCISWLREQEKLRSYAAQMEVASEVDEALAESYEEHLQFVEETLSQMSPQTQLILERHYYHHKTYQEIADELQVNHRLVKRRIAEALTTFRNLFNKNKDQEGGPNR